MLNFAINPKPANYEEIFPANPFCAHFVILPGV
jgi:hypothetical protein